MEIHIKILPSKENTTIVRKGKSPKSNEDFTNRYRKVPSRKTIGATPCPTAIKIREWQRIIPILSLLSITKTTLISPQAHASVFLRAFSASTSL